jgi:hypothetical protein
MIAYRKLLSSWATAAVILIRSVIGAEPLSLDARPARKVEGGDG